MTYATVALDQPNEARLQVAGEFPERFEAVIIGVAAAQFAPPLYFTDGAEAGLIDQGEASVKRRLAGLEAQFRAATRNRDGHIFRPDSSWRRRAVPISSSAAGAARHSPMPSRSPAPGIW